MDSIPVGVWDVANEEIGSNMYGSKNVVRRNEIWVGNGVVVRFLIVGLLFITVVICSVVFIVSRYEY